jgi:arsenical pump membrane protein
MTGNVFQNVLVGSLSSTLFANIMNNQPMTVLFTKTLNDPILLGTGIEYEALLYGLIIGSNLGANITFFGALAGLMWRKMLSDMGEKVQLSIFFKTGIKTILPVIFITSITLAIMLSLK